MDVHLIGARHLPSSFGLKSVEGYIVKVRPLMTHWQRDANRCKSFQVKLFPGSTKFDSSIQSSSWPKFNETFRFPMAPLHKWESQLQSRHFLSYQSTAFDSRSSLKSKQRDYNRDINGNVSLPEKLFKGTFVVFTVIALLELPAGVSGNCSKVIFINFCYDFSRSQGSKARINRWSGKAAWSSAIEHRKYSHTSI